jgi:argininosuccinate lyase
MQPHMHLWSGRFDGEPDPDVFEFGRSFPFDCRLFEDDVTGSLAWVEALALAGAVRPGDAHVIAVALRDLLSSGLGDPAFVQGDDEDVHAFVERALVERVGPVGKRLHTGRSRNEQVSVDLRLYLKRRIPLLQRALGRLVAALAVQADAAGDSVMPAYTHLRRAQPVLVAHFLLGHAAAFRRDYEHFDFATRTADALPLGSGAIAGTSYLIDTAALARRLGFSRVVANSIDASSDRDFVAVFLHACALSMVHISRLAEDLVLFTGEEFGFFELSDSVATGSSLMPQKKNPDPLELVRGKAGRAIGHLAGWLATMKGLPSGYNKDLQEDKEALFDAESTLARSLATVAAVVRTLRARTDAMATAASGLLLATDVAEYLVARGVPFREAHETVGRMVRRLVGQRRGFEALTIEEWKTFSPLFESGIFAVITPRTAVAARLTPQSTNPVAVAAALKEVEQWLEAVLGPGGGEADGATGRDAAAAGSGKAGA